MSLRTGKKAMAILLGQYYSYAMTGWLDRESWMDARKGPLGSSMIYGYRARNDPEGPRKGLSQVQSIPTGKHRYERSEYYGSLSAFPVVAFYKSDDVALYM